MAYPVRLAVFEGPLDLLLHLIRAQKIEVTDIPVASVTEQYLEYLALMEEMDLDVAGEFMVMAATLMEIKSRMLLPRPPREAAAEEGPDPREELVRRLLEYEQYQHAAEALRSRSEEARRSFPRQVSEETPEPPLRELSAGALLGALRRMLFEQVDGNGKAGPTLRVRREPINLNARIREIWGQVSGAAEPLAFSTLLPPERRTRRQVIVTFLAILELLREGKITAWQRGVGGEILLKAA